MGQYSTRGLYAAYDRNQKERQKEDYYATPPAEVTNILSQLGIDFANDVILEPCCGGGHMVEGILKYQEPKKLIATDIKDRGYHPDKDFIEVGYDLDYMSDDYPYEEADWIIMNPPFKLIEPFCIRSLEIAKKGIIMFGRLQFLEGQGRYENILKDNPPSDIYVYVDRVVCYKDGDFSLPPSGIQAYSWYVWRSEEEVSAPRLHWIRRAQ